MDITLKYYRSQSKYSDPGKYSSLFDSFPDDIRELCNIVHGLIAHHDDTQENYGFAVPKEKLTEANFRYVEKILDTILTLDSSPLAKEREPINRYLGSCRDFAIMLCSILRYKGIPSRLRCGFAGYFGLGHFSDHWVCEYWNQEKQKWLLVDSEIGEVERKRYNFILDNTNLPRDKFQVAGSAWKLCKEGKADPSLYGVVDIGIVGFWFIRADILRDLASLNKIELLPWDYTKYFDKPFKSLNELPKKEVDLIDKIVDLTSNPDFKIEDIQEIYNSNPDLQVKNPIKSYLTSEPVEVNL